MREPDGNGANCLDHLHNNMHDVSWLEEHDTTTSCDMVEDTFPTTLKEDEEPSEPEAAASACRDLSLLFARGCKISCLDVCT